MDKLLGQVLSDRYCIQSLLGHKTGRRTFLANDLQTKSPVVIKLLLFNPDFTWDDLKLFEREAETLKSLDHPAIPRYLDSFEIDTKLGKGFALVQSYIEARSLQEWMQSGRTFSEQELQTIAEELLGILDYLHSHRPSVIHRDIKPSNILLGDRSGNSPGQVYLVDFGSVQTIKRDDTITIVGTYGYMPPEQFEGKAVPASDIYSFGVTLIYLLTGIHPADLPKRNGRIQFERHCSTDKQFQTWLRCMIHTDVKQRFASAQLALAALQKKSLASQSVQIRLVDGAKKQIYYEKSSEALTIYKCNPGYECNSGMHLGCAFLILMFATLWMLQYSPIWWLVLIFEFVIGYWFEDKQNHSNYEMWRFEGNEFTVRQLADPVKTLKVIDVADVKAVEVRKFGTDGGAYCGLAIYTVNNVFTISINSCDEAQILKQEIENRLNIK